MILGNLKSLLELDRRHRIFIIWTSRLSCKLPHPASIYDRSNSVTRLVLLSHRILSHLQQSYWSDQEESRFRGSMRPCLRLRSACLSFSMQETFESALKKLKLNVAAKNHSKQNTLAAQDIPMKNQ